MQKLVQFLGQEVALSLRMSTSRSIAIIGKDSLSSLRYSLDKYSFDVHVDIAAPILVLPILKNNDPQSPLWALKLGDLLVKSAGSGSGQAVNLAVELTKINIEVVCVLRSSITQGLWTT